MEGQSRLRKYQVEPELLKDESEGFVTCNQTAPVTGRAIERISALVPRQVWEARRSQPCRTWALWGTFLPMVYCNITNFREQKTLQTAMCDRTPRLSGDTCQTSERPASTPLRQPPDGSSDDPPRRSHDRHCRTCGTRRSCQTF